MPWGPNATPLRRINFVCWPKRLVRRLSRKIVVGEEKLINIMLLTNYIKETFRAILSDGIAVEWRKEI